MCRPKVEILTNLTPISKNLNRKKMSSRSCQGSCNGGQMKTIGNCLD
jgi:hypothetical protein